MQMKAVRQYLKIRKESNPFLLQQRQKYPPLNRAPAMFPVMPDRGQFNPATWAVDHRGENSDEAGNTASIG